MYALNETVTMKKPHPCGGKEWEVMRVGADIKLRCLTCGRLVTMTRDELKRRAKTPAGEKRAESEK